MKARELRKEIRADAEKSLAGHKGSRRESVSWHFNSTSIDKVTGKELYDWNLAYAVTWTAGTLVLSGDIGERTITHYHAMKTAIGAARWMLGAEFDYIMGKSDAQQKPDVDATLASILEWANEPALEDLRNLRDEKRRYRDDRAEAVVEHAAALIAATQAGSEETLDLDDFLPDEGGYTLKLEVKAASRDFLSCKRIGGFYYDAPDGFRNWLRLWDAVGGCDLEGILTGAGRREIREELEGRLSGADANEIARLCCEIGIDDYYGSSDYPPRLMFQFVALQRWAAHVIAEHEAATAAAAEVAS